MTITTKEQRSEAHSAQVRLEAPVTRQQLNQVYPYLWCHMEKGLLFLEEKNLKVFLQLIQKPHNSDHPRYKFNIS